MNKSGFFSASFDRGSNLIQALELIGPAFDDQSFAVRHGIACMIVAPIMTRWTIGSILCDPITGRAKVKDIEESLRHALAGTEFRARIAQYNSAHLVVQMTPERWNIYKHDCDRCTPLGSCMDGETIYDLYHCDKSIPTVIARYGNEGHEYTSGIGMPIGPIREAERRARGMGLL